MSNKNDNQIKLSDGHYLGYAEYGDPNGKPVLQFHGWCSSRFEGNLSIIQHAASKLHVRLIVFERPGMGLSSFKPKRHILDWPKDISEFADALKLERFSVLGYSSGGPYVAACALKIPERLTGAALLSGDAPHDIPEVAAVLDKQTRQFDSLSDKVPWLFSILLGMSFRKSRKKPIEQAIASVFPGELPAKDQEAFSHPETGTWFGEMIREGARPGARGPAWDWTLSARPWGFYLQDVSFRIHIFQGEADTLNPIAFGRYMAGVLPNNIAEFYPNDGHISLIYNHYEEMLSTVI